MDMIKVYQEQIDEELKKPKPDKLYIKRLRDNIEAEKNSVHKDEYLFYLKYQQEILIGSMLFLIFLLKRRK